MFDVQYLALGQGDTTDRSSPTRVDVGTPIASLTAAQDHTCAIDTAGTLYCWGRNTEEQLGDDSAIVDSV